MAHTDIVDEYLRVLGLQRSKPDLVFLNEITRCHAAKFAFSSVGPMLGDDLPLDIESLYQRIVLNRRGGYCFEQNGFLYAILEELGFDVRLYLARVIYNQDIHPGLTHRITLVNTGDERYVADVGFGPMGPQFPVSMSGEELHESFRIFRIRARQDGELHMQTLRDGEFYSLYKFELVRYGPADCEVGHFYSHKHPGATFLNHLVVSKIMDDEVRSLRDREYWIITASGERKHHISDGAQLKMVLADRFGIIVSAAEGQRLFERSA